MKVRDMYAQIEKTKKNDRRETLNSDVIAKRNNSFKNLIAKQIKKPYKKAAGLLGGQQLIMQLSKVSDWATNMTTDNFKLKHLSSNINDAAYKSHKRSADDTVDISTVIALHEWNMDSMPNPPAPGMKYTIPGLHIAITTDNETRVGTGTVTIHADDKGKIYHMSHSVMTK